MCMIDYADAPEWSMRAKRKARKQHQCSECSRAIEPGEEYEYSAGKFEGEICQFKTCIHCISARVWLDQVCGGFCYSCVQEDLLHHWDDNPEYRSLWLGRAILGMRRQWRRPNGELLPLMRNFVWVGVIPVAVN